MFKSWKRLSLARSPLRSLGIAAVAMVVVAAILLGAASATAPEGRPAAEAAGSVPYRLAEPGGWSQTPPNGALVERDRFHQVVGVWGCLFFDDFYDYERLYSAGGPGEARVASVAALSVASEAARAEAEGSCGYVAVYPVPPPVGVVAPAGNAWQCADHSRAVMLVGGLWVSSKLNLRLIYDEPFDRGRCDFFALPEAGIRGKPVAEALVSASTRLASYLTVLELSPETRDAARALLDGEPAVVAGGPLPLRRLSDGPSLVGTVRDYTGLSDLASLLADLVPAIGTAKASVELVTGDDPVNGARLSEVDRVASGVAGAASLLLGVGIVWGAVRRTRH